MYRRIRKSDVARQMDILRDEMQKLQQAIKRVSENWNDAVAQGIQTGHINNIVSSCNSINGTLMNLGLQIETDLTRLEELEMQSQRTASTGSL